MPNYIQDPNNSDKQVPGRLTDKHFDRVRAATEFSASKTPNYVVITAKPSDGNIGFYFGSYLNFSASAAIESINNTHPSLSGSQHYQQFGAPAIGTRLDINPIAFSGSEWGVSFIYKGGLDGMGRL